MVFAAQMFVYQHGDEVLTKKKKAILPVPSKIILITYVSLAPLLPESGPLPSVLHMIS